MVVVFGVLTILKSLSDSIPDTFSVEDDFFEKAAGNSLITQVVSCLFNRVIMAIG